MGAGCLHSTGELLWWTSKPSSILPFSFSCQALTRPGSVGQSSWRFMPCMQLERQACSSFILFLTHVNMCQSGDLWEDGQTSSLGYFWKPRHAELQFCLISLLSTFAGCRTNCQSCPEVWKNGRPLMRSVVRVVAQIFVHEFPVS